MLIKEVFKILRGLRKKNWRILFVKIIEILENPSERAAKYEEELFNLAREYGEELNVFRKDNK